MAIREDPLPSLQTQLTALSSIGDVAGAAEVVAKIETETEKRAQWAVSLTLNS